MSKTYYARTSTVSAVASSATSGQIVAASASRLGLSLYNSDANDCYVKFGTTATTSDFTVKIPSGGFYEMPTDMIYIGRIDAIWSADGSGSLHVTELT